MASQPTPANATPPQKEGLLIGLYSEEGTLGGWVHQPLYKPANLPQVLNTYTVEQ